MQLEHTINLRNYSDIISLLYIITHVFHNLLTNGIMVELMSKITVSETVSRSVTIDNSIADIQTAMIRCFQFLEEGRFKEANVIIEQVLNIDPNNPDANVANFLYHFELTSAEDVIKNFKNYVTYENSVFYKRVKRCAQSELSKKLDFCLGRASEQLKNFTIEEERRIKEEAQRKEREEREEKKKEKIAWIWLIIMVIVVAILLALGQYGAVIVVTFIGFIIICIIAIHHKS